jgi:hypothetical protein
MDDAMALHAAKRQLRAAIKNKLRSIPHDAILSQSMQAMTLHVI